MGMSIDLDMVASSSDSEGNHKAMGNGECRHAIAEFAPPPRLTQFVRDHGLRFGHDVDIGNGAHLHDFNAVLQLGPMWRLSVLFVWL